MGTRLLILITSPEEDTFGYLGTILLSALHGKVIQPVCFIDSTIAPKNARSKKKLNYARCIKHIWEEVGALSPIILPSEDPTPSLRSRLITIVRRFEPDTLFVPTFLEKQEAPRQLNELLLMMAEASKLLRNIEIWGYQVQGRMPGNIVNDVSRVHKRKIHIIKEYLPDNKSLRISHLCSGQDIVTTYYLKPASSRPRKGYAEAFLVFPIKKYCILSNIFHRIPDRKLSSVEKYHCHPNFFIIGLQKSGTFWLTALLDAHPMVRCFPEKPGHPHGLGEVHLFDLIARMREDYRGGRAVLSRKAGGALAEYLPTEPPQAEDEWDRLLEHLRDGFSLFCHELRIKCGKPIIGEKTAESVHHLDLVEKMFPDALKVCILRDPRDRVVSFYYHQLRKRQIPETSQLDGDFIRRYVERVERDYVGLLRMQRPYHLLTYENLWSETSREASNVLTALNLRPLPTSVAAMIRDASFRHLAGRPIGTEDINSHYRKGLPGDWRNHLDPASAVDIVNQLAPLTRSIETRFGLDLSVYGQA